MSRFIGVAMVIFLSIPVRASSQTLMLGGKVAGQATTTFTEAFSPDVVHEDRFLFGPMAEVRLTHRFSVEVDALYKRKLNYTDTFSYFEPGSLKLQVRTETHDVTARSWEIPVIMKWYPVNHPIRPFLGGGFSSRNVSGTTHIFGTVSGNAGIPPSTFDSQTSDGDLVHHWTYGITADAGVNIRAGIFHFQPELRYTRWLSSPFYFETRLDSIQILMGVAVGK
jgi:hypothetical protein